MEHAAGIRGDAHASQGADARRGTRRGDGASGLHFQPVWRGGLGSTRMGEVHHRVSPRVLATEPKKLLTASTRHLVYYKVTLTKIGACWTHSWLFSMSGG